MANYSKEAERQSKAIQSILDGKEPEKRIMVGYQGDTIGLTETEKEERKVSSERANVLKEARMPWFCPECKKIMKTRLDTKFYYLQSRCYDCVVKEETKMRINGTYEEYEEIKVRENKRSYIKDLKQTIEEWKNSPDAVTFLNQVRADGYSVDEEKWGGDDGEEMKKLIVEAEEYLEKLEETI
jgi:hypothetical protein